MRVTSQPLIVLVGIYRVLHSLKIFLFKWYTVVYHEIFLTFSSVAGMSRLRGMSLGTKNRYDLQGAMVSSSPYANTYPAGQSVIHVCMGFQVLSKTELSVLNWACKPDLDPWSHTGEWKILECFQKVVCYLMLMKFNATLKTRICKITQNSTNYCLFRLFAFSCKSFAFAKEIVFTLKSIHSLTNFYPYHIISITSFAFIQNFYFLLKIFVRKGLGEHKTFESEGMKSHLFNYSFI